MSEATGMEHTTEQVARLIEAHNEITRDTEFGGIVCAECGWSLAYKSPGDSVNFVSNSKAEHLAHALAESGLLAPAPLTEEWAVVWVRRGGEVSTYPCDDEADEMTVRRYVSDWLPVDPAEGDGSADQ